jgi:LL-H family phage holin
MDITHILQLAILLISAIVAAFVIPILKQKLGRDKLNRILVYVEAAVTAAEQLYNSEQGQEKKAYVLEYLNTELAKNGLTVDMETLENLIEAQVLILHNQLKQE